MRYWKGEFGCINMMLSVTGFWLPPPPPSGDPHAAPVQLHGSRPGKERQDQSPGRLFTRSRRQQHPAQLLRERRDHPAGARGPGWVALRRKREDQDVRTAQGSRLIHLHFGVLWESFIYLSSPQAWLVSVLLHPSDLRWRGWLDEAASSTEVCLWWILCWTPAYNFTPSPFICVFFKTFFFASLHGKSSSTGNLLEREDMAITAPDYNMHPRVAAQSSAPVHGRQQRPYSMAAPGFPQVHTFGRDTWAGMLNKMWLKMCCLSSRGEGRALFWRDVASCARSRVSLCKQANQFPSTSHSPSQGCVKKKNSWINSSWQVDYGKKEEAVAVMMAVVGLIRFKPHSSNRLMQRLRRFRPRSRVSPGTLDVGRASLSGSHVTT